MSHYRIVDVRVWNDERFRPFSITSKLAFLFVLTHPHLTAIGAMRGTMSGLAAELGWPSRRLRAAVSPAVLAGMVEVNERAAYIGLPNFLKYNPPQGPNSVKRGWISALDGIPECQEKRALILRCRKYLDSKSREFKECLGPDVWEAFSDAMPDGTADATEDAKRDASPIQEQEQDQESIPAGPVRNKPPALGFDEFWREYTRHDAKRAAEKVWLKLSPSAEQRTTIMSAVATQKRPGGVLNPASGSKFIPYASTWLNRLQWEDEAAPSSRTRRNELPLMWKCDECGEHHLTPPQDKGRCPQTASTTTQEATE